MISVMTGSLVSQVRLELPEDQLRPDTNIKIATAVSFLIGIYQLIFGIMQMGLVSVYLSEQLVSGFTTAASLYVFTSQLEFLFGFEHMTHKSGPLALINTYIELFNQISHSNFTALGISAICCIILIIFKFYLTPKLQRKTGLNVPIPIELGLVIIGILVSTFCELQENTGIKIVGQIPSGLPSWELPDWSLVSHL